MRRNVMFVLVLVALFSSAAALAEKPLDFARQGPANPPAIEASEDTPIDYNGGVPGPVVGALDADDSTYNRLVSDCGAPSGVGTDVYYDTITITNQLAVQADFVVETSGVGTPGTCGSVDTFLTAYGPTFDPANPDQNCIDSDDDGGDSTCSLINFSIAAGETAVVVVTSFGNGVTGDYQVNFDGTVPVELMSISVD